MDEKYIEMVKGLSVNPEVCRKQHDLKIVYTPIHGIRYYAGANGLESIWI